MWFSFLDILHSIFDALVYLMSLCNSMFAWLLLVLLHALQQQLLSCLCEASTSAISGLIAGASAFNGSRREMIEGQYTTPGHLSYKVLPLQACLTSH